MKLPTDLSPPLMKSIELDLEFISDENFYFSENDDLCLRTTGETIDKLKEEINLFLDITVDMYIINKNQDAAAAPTPKFKKAIDKLRQIIDPIKKQIN